MKRLLLASSAALAALALVVLARPAAAATATANLTVSATVVGHCTIDALAVAFGTYDSTATIDVPTNIVIHCTPGASYWVGLGPGNNAAGTRQMIDAVSGDLLAYELYSDNGYSTVFTNAAPPLPYPVANLPGLAQYQIALYARLPAGQIRTAGSYADTVLMTVNF
jgi:spore coat protein U-like protein